MNQTTFFPFPSQTHNNKKSIYQDSPNIKTNLLVRPYPSFCIVFVSSALRIPGLLQSPFLHASVAPAKSVTASWMLSKPAPPSLPKSSGSPKAARHHLPTIRLRHSNPSAFTLALPPPTTITPTTTIKMMMGGATSPTHPPPPPALPHAAAHHHISI